MGKNTTTCRPRYVNFKGKYNYKVTPKNKTCLLLKAWWKNLKLLYHWDKISLSFKESGLSKAQKKRYQKKIDKIDKEITALGRV